MVILDNSRTLGAFERQSRIIKILFLYLHQINKVLIIKVMFTIQSKLLKRIL